MIVSLSGDSRGFADPRSRAAADHSLACIYATTATSCPAEPLQRYVAVDSESEVTRQLDELAAEMDTSMDPVVKELQRRALAPHGG